MSLSGGLGVDVCVLEVVWFGVFVVVERKKVGVFGGGFVFLEVVIGGG